MGKSVVVAAHGHCFDGMCSSAIFNQLLTKLNPNEQLDFTYRACGYGPGENGVDPKYLVGQENVILDYRYSTSDKLTYYFDHHASAFPSPEERASFEAAKTKSPARMFHDAAYGSCTKLIFDMARERLGVDLAEHAELVRWADIIDAARFPNAEMAVARKEPALQLMTVVENHGDAAFYAELVPLLLTKSIDEIAAMPRIKDLFTPKQAELDGFVKLVEAAAVEKDGVVLVDLTANMLAVSPKFVTYALYPQSRYSIVVTRDSKRVKLSIGYNPWSQKPRTHDISKICERHGGGGHPVVGAITLTAGDLEKARTLAKDLAAELGTG
jgi:hypothetical protein